MVKLEALLLSHPVSMLETVLTAIAGSRDRALLAILEHATFEEFMACNGWTLEVVSISKIDELRKNERGTYNVGYLEGPEDEDSSHGVLFIRKKDHLVYANQKWSDICAPYYEKLRAVTA